jgi:hypothetical protein
MLLQSATKARQKQRSLVWFSLINRPREGSLQSGALFFVIGLLFGQKHRPLGYGRIRESNLVVMPQDRSELIYSNSSTTVRRE